MKKIIYTLSLIFIIPTIYFCEANMSYANSHCPGLTINVNVENPAENYKYKFDPECECGKKTDLYNEDNELIGYSCVDEYNTDTYLTKDGHEIFQIRKFSNDTFYKYSEGKIKTSYYKVINDNLTYVYSKFDKKIGKIVTKDNKKFYYDQKGNLLASGDKNKKFLVTFCEFGGVPKISYTEQGKRGFIFCMVDDKRGALYNGLGKIQMILRGTVNSNEMFIIGDQYGYEKGMLIIKNNTYSFFDEKMNYMMEFKFEGQNIAIIGTDKKEMGTLHFKK